MNVAKLRGKMVEASVTQEKMSEILGISLSTFSRKLNAEGGDTFTIGDAMKMVDTLMLTREEAEAIFFPNNVA